MITTIFNTLKDFGIFESSVLFFVLIFLGVFFYQSTKKRFFVSLYSEFKKVEWLSKKDLYSFAISNIVLITFLTLAIYGLDKLLFDLKKLLPI